MKKTMFLAAALAALLALPACARITVTMEAAPLTSVSAPAEAAEGPGPSEVPEMPDYGVYAPFGLTYDEAEDALYFDGQRVRYFFDGVDTGDGGQISHAEHMDPAGTVDVHTVRKTVDNGDGSVNPFGPLTGLEADSQAVFDARDIDALLHPSMEATACGQTSGEPGRPFTEIFAAYRDYGVEFVESPAGSGRGNVYLNGALADVFADVSEAGSFVFHSTDRGDFSVRAVRDGAGSLTGVERFTGEIELG